MTTESETRKATPIYSGVLRYFPDALAAVARLSKAGNDKHNPGQPLHWSREKSTDHGDCIVRHQMTPEAVDPETGELHAAAVAWRALAQLQLLEEAKRLEVLAGPAGRVQRVFEQTYPRPQTPKCAVPGANWERGNDERPDWADETTLVDLRQVGETNFRTRRAWDLVWDGDYEYRKHQYRKHQA